MRTLSHEKLESQREPGKRAVHFVLPSGSEAGGASANFGVGRGHHAGVGRHRPPPRRRPPLRPNTGPCLLSREQGTAGPSRTPTALLLKGARYFCDWPLPMPKARKFDSRLSQHAGIRPCTCSARRHKAVCTCNARRHNSLYTSPGHGCLRVTTRPAS